MTIHSFRSPTPLSGAAHWYPVPGSSNALGPPIGGPKGVDPSLPLVGRQLSCLSPPVTDFRYNLYEIDAQNPFPSTSKSDWDRQWPRSWRPLKRHPLSPSPSLQQSRVTSSGRGSVMYRVSNTVSWSTKDRQMYRMILVGDLRLPLRL